MRRVGWSVMGASGVLVAITATVIMTQSGDSQRTAITVPQGENAELVVPRMSSVNVPEVPPVATSTEILTPPPTTVTQPTTPSATQPTVPPTMEEPRQPAAVKPKVPSPNTDVPSPNTDVPPPSPSPSTTPSSDTPQPAPQPANQAPWYSSYGFPWYSASRCYPRCR